MCHPFRNTFIWRVILLKRVLASLCAAVAAVCMIVMPTSAASAATTGPVLASGFPGIACANSGPAKAWPSANSDARRGCWWGYEIFYSKNSSKLIATGAGGAVGGLAAAYLPSRVALLVLFGTASGVSMERIDQKINGGTCVKITVIYPAAVYPSSYSCY